jgi:uncharacterized DUF497 family protein
MNPLLVSRRSDEIDRGEAPIEVISIISARRATRAEISAYEEG